MANKMKKKIYFKEDWNRFLAEDGKHKRYCCEIFWKKHRWWPFWKKMDGTFDALEKNDLFLKYEEEYEVYIWDDIFSQFVPMKYLL